MYHTTGFDREPYSKPQLSGSSKLAGVGLPSGYQT